MRVRLHRLGTVKEPVTRTVSGTVLFRGRYYNALSSDMDYIEVGEVVEIVSDYGDYVEVERANPGGYTRERKEYDYRGERRKPRKDKRSKGRNLNG